METEQPGSPVKDTVPMTKPAHPKLPRIPNKYARVRKRPLLHPPIPSPYTSSDQQKVVYIRPGTTFLSAVSRVRKLLAHAEKRAMGKVEIFNDNASDRRRLQALAEKMDETAAARQKKKKGEEVVLKGTNRAIERVLAVALYFQKQPDCLVRIRTGTVAAIDDIVERESKKAQRRGNKPDPELPESRIRYISCVEAAVSLR